VLPCRGRAFERRQLNAIHEPRSCYRATQPARLTRCRTPKRSAIWRNFARVAAKKRPISRPSPSFSIRFCQLWALHFSRSKIPASSGEIDLSLAKEPAGIVDQLDVVPQRNAVSRAFAELWVRGHHPFRVWIPGAAENCAQESRLSRSARLSRHFRTDSHEHTTNAVHRSTFASEWQASQAENLLRFGAFHPRFFQRRSRRHTRHAPGADHARPGMPGILHRQARS
jgi:hypothetical protein